MGYCKFIDFSIDNVILNLPDEFSLTGQMSKLIQKYLITGHYHKL